MECSNVTDPSIKIKVSKKSNLADEEYLAVNVSRVLHPSKTDRVSMISPSHSKIFYFFKPKKKKLISSN
jgi:hypothetical protein